MPSNSLKLTFSNEPLNVGIWGLYGCTAVIMVSTKAVWVAHFYEAPSFILDPPIDPVLQEAVFKRDVIDVIGPGDNTQSMVGLGDHSQSPGSDFGINSSPRYIIVTASDDSGLLLRYDKEISQIQTEILRLVPHAVHGALDGIISYRPSEHTTANLATSPAGKVLLQFDPQERLQDVGQCPTVNTEYEAEVRVWVEGKRFP